MLSAKERCIWTVVLEKTLQSPLDSKIKPVSTLKEIDLEYSLEGLILKLKLQYFGHLMWTANTLEKTLIREKIEDRRRGDNRGWDGSMASPTQLAWVWASSRIWWRTGKAGMLQSIGSQSQTQPIDWTTTYISLVAQMVKDPSAMWENWVQSWVGKIPWRMEWQPTPVFLPGESPWTDKPVWLQSMGS